jgi:hypothetical protein
VGSEEVDDLTPRIGRGVRIVSQPHPENRAVGQAHVERVWSVGIDHQLQVGSRLGLDALHLLAEAGRGHRIASTDQHEQWSIERAGRIRLTAGVEGDPRPERPGGGARGAQGCENRPASVRHPEDDDAIRVDVGADGQPGTDAIRIIGAADCPRGHPASANLIDSARSEAVHHGCGNPMVPEQIDPWVDPCRPHRLVMKTTAPVQQHDERERPPAIGRVDRHGQLTVTPARSVPRQTLSERRRRGPGATGP